MLEPTGQAPASAAYSPDQGIPVSHQLPGRKVFSSAEGSEVEERWIAPDTASFMPIIEAPLRQRTTDRADITALEGQSWSERWRETLHCCQQAINDRSY
ncbi:hypothetical protein A7C99_6727 [Trichophyton rubrum]|uniref:Uncharacterized protein n=1 Tax=Trichophyton rubrum TaxID=5551 RepID=A0A178EQ36_TRIRU|nr:hypothetical protein A7C99_6727 [Trichophyton rubrum]